MIKILKYIILGIVQGFTEPLPISSSGHVFIIKKLIESSALNDLNFEIIVNTGSLIAVLIIYYKDIKRLIINFFKYIFSKEKTYYNDFKYCLLIVIGVIPVGIAGILLKDYIESKLNNTYIIGICFLITSLFLFLTRNIKGKKDDKNLNYMDALFIGIIQIVALLPGLSRSGTTLVAALYRDINRESALKYSFMLYIPISLGTLILGVKDIIETPNISSYTFPYLCGFISSLIVSYFTLRWFKNAVNKGKLIYFSIYCLLIGLFVLIFM